MYNPIRRNRNIGTNKQGHGNNNKLVIPNSWHDRLLYLEKVNEYQVLKQNIKNKEYTFIIENTRANSYHCCTIDDICRILEMIPEHDLDGLDIIVLRQPKRKEEIIEPVWGRLRYFAEVANRFKGPCIMLEAIDISKKMKYGSKSQSVEGLKEYNRLVEDGHIFEQSKKEIIIIPNIENVRNTQLYRTLLHEIGHYVHYLEVVVGRSKDETEISDNIDKYHSIQTIEKEKFAHNYADNKRKELLSNNQIPFQRIVNMELINQNNLKVYRDGNHLTKPSDVKRSV